MARSKTHFEEFEPHTLLKHAVLKAYLQTWMRKMLLRPGAGAEICFVDACAGKGCDEHGRPGSPVLAAVEAKKTEAQLRDQYGRESRVHVLAIEKKASHFLELRKNLEPFPETATALRGTLADHIDDHFARFGETPTLFFIDPFGLEPLDAEVIRRAINGGPRNEVFLLFADQAALRHFGAATALAPDLEEAVSARIPQQQSLFGDDAEVEKRIRDDLETKHHAKVAGQELTRPAAMRILNSAFAGEDWLEQIGACEPSRRRERFLAMYTALLRRMGAQYVLPLPMRSEADKLVYHLIHATKSAHGYTAMKDVISAELKRAALSEDVVETMRFAIRSDLDAVEAAVRRQFAGRRVPLTSKESRQPTLRKFVLEETDAFHFEFDELKQRLKPYKDPGKGPVHYSFPPLA